VGDVRGRGPDLRQWRWCRRSGDEERWRRRWRDAKRKFGIRIRTHDRPVRTARGVADIGCHTLHPNGQAGRCVHDGRKTDSHRFRAVVDCCRLHINDVDPGDAIAAGDSNRHIGAELIVCAHREPDRGDYSRADGTPDTDTGADGRPDTDKRADGSPDTDTRADRGPDTDSDSGADGSPDTDTDSSRSCVLRLNASVAD
jgi:hypothetical protein